MTIESTTDNTPTAPAITYSECYVQPFFSFYNADNMAIMKTFKDKEFDLAIVDIPYGLGDKLTQGGTWASKYKKGDAAWDILPNAEYFNELFRISKEQIIWGGNYANLPPSRCFLIWDKVAQMETMADCEFAWTSFDKNAKIFRHVRNTSEKRIHITQKPVKLYEWILQNYAKNDFKIIDTHLGSGSIAIAIDKANTLDKKNLTFVGIELDPDYYRAAVERFKNHKRQCVLF
jgi:site-specific DNA-methyltransferase (adenine-specific)